MMGSFQLLRPAWLLALVPAALIWWSLWRANDPRGIWAHHIAPHLLPHLLVKQDRGRQLRPLHAIAALWVLMCVAMAGPAWRPVPSPFADSEAGLMVVLKVTPSMMAGDVPPSRLERSLQKLQDLLELRQGAPTGLIVYSGTSHLVMPLTSDSDVLLFMTEGLTPEMMPQEGDVLAEALARADKLIARAERPGSILLMADAVLSSQQAALDKAPPNAKVQVFAMAPPAALDPSLQRLATALGAPLVSLSADDRDVKSVARSAGGEVVAMAGDKQDRRMQDEGFLLLPLIALGALLWARKGWMLT